MHATKKGNAFLIYLLSMLDVESSYHETPSQYKEFKDVFDKKNVNTCWNIIHMIAPSILKKEHNFQLDPFTTCHKTNLHLFMNTLTRILKRGSFSIPNLQPMPLSFFVNKKYGSLWLCIDYRELDWFATKNCYLLPLISWLLDQLSHAKVYTKIDLCKTYNLMCIRKVINERWCFEHVTTISNTLWCLLALPMHLLWRAPKFFNGLKCESKLKTTEK
jgi:hypothetical protein